MRRFSRIFPIIAFVAMLIPTQSRADYFSLAANQNYQVSGPFNIYDPVFATVSFGGSATVPDGHDQAGYWLSVSVAGNNLTTCGHRYCIIAPPYASFLVSRGSPQFHVSPFTVGAWVWDEDTGYVAGLPSTVTGYALILDLPDGFSISSVPELSTWAMLMIGFISVASLRFRRRLYDAV